MIDRQLTLPGEVFHEIERNAQRVVQPESVLARHDAAAGRGTIEDLLQSGKPGGQHGVESILLASDDAHDVVAPGAKLGVGVAHLGDDDIDERVQHRLGEAELLAVTHRAPHDLAQHVAAPLVRGDDPVGDEERHGAEVIRDDAHRDVCRLLERRAVSPAGAIADGGQDGREEVRVVVGELALDDGRDALEAHARVDRRRGQGNERSIRLAVELHEHVVPDFDEPVAAAVDAEAGPAAPLFVAGDVIAAEIVNLGAAPAGAGLAHGPEILGQAQLGDPVGGHELGPDRVRVRVARDGRLSLEDRWIEPFRGQLPRRRQELPGKRDRLFLEVVAEREVPQHLEEGVMPERGPDVVEVVVLAADAHALLRCRGARVGPLLAAEKRVFELVHPGVGEEQRRVVAGHQRRTRDDRVSLPLEVLEEAAANLARVHLVWLGSGLRLSKAQAASEL